MSGHQRILQYQEKEAIAELAGVSFSILFDGQVTEEEVEIIKGWLSLKVDYKDRWPISELYTLLMEISGDGKVTPDERLRLFTFLNSNFPSKAYGATPDSIYDADPAVEFRGRCFVFTGDMAYCGRTDAEEAVVARGGRHVDSVSPVTDYLVVGSLGSEEWKHGRFGRKIEKAMNLNQSKTATIIIVKEADFIKALPSAKILPASRRPSRNRIITIRIG